MSPKTTAKQGASPRLFPVRDPSGVRSDRPGTAWEVGEVDDATLARAGVEGQAWAQREIWFRFAPMVNAFLRRSLGSRHDCEDLIQEIFLRVFKRLSSIENPAVLRSFIFSFAVRVVSEEIRRHSIRSRLAAVFFRPSAEPSVPHVDFESRELLRRIQAVLDRMNSRHRAVFVLRHLEGVELSEIASNLDLSLATVKRDLDKAHRFVARSVRRDEGLRVGLGTDFAQIATEEEP